MIVDVPRDGRAHVPRDGRVCVYVCVCVGWSVVREYGDVGT